MGRPSAADQEEQPLRSPDRRRPGFRQMLADSNKRPLSCLLGRGAGGQAAGSLDPVGQAADTALGVDADNGRGARCQDLRAADHLVSMPDVR